MALVRPKQAFVSTAGPTPYTLGPTDLLDEHNAHVRAQPDMFEPVAATVPEIETADARPGEKRSTRAPR